MDFLFRNLQSVKANWTSSLIRIFVWIWSEAKWLAASGNYSPKNLQRCYCSSWWDKQEKRKKNRKASVKALVHSPTILSCWLWSALLPPHQGRSIHSDLVLFSKSKWNDWGPLSWYMEIVQQTSKTGVSKIYTLCQIQLSNIHRFSLPLDIKKNLKEICRSWCNLFSNHSSFFFLWFSAF